MYLISYVKSIINRKKKPYVFVEINFGSFRLWKEIFYFIVQCYRDTARRSNCGHVSAGVPRVYDSHVEQRQCSKINSTLHNNTLDLSYVRFIGVLRGRISFFNISAANIELRINHAWQWADCVWKRNNPYIFKSNRHLLRARTPSLQHSLPDLFATRNQRCNVFVSVTGIVILRRITKKKGRKIRTIKKQRYIEIKRGNFQVS